MSEARRFRYLADANTPRSLVRALTQRGRDAIESRDIMPADAKDQSIAHMAALHGFVLVSFDRDFVDIRGRMLQERACGGSHLVLLRVPEMPASNRLGRVIDHVEQLIHEADAPGRPLDRIEVRQNRVVVFLFM